MVRICALLSVVLLAVVLLALRLGAVPFSLGDLGQNLWWLASGHPEKLSTDFRLIMVDIRLPRILLGIFVGAALSVAGASFQALLRNPLADPYVLGVSNGAALGVLVALLVAPALPLMTPLAAFLGATTTISAVYLLGRRQGQLDSNTLLLAGIITASFLSAIIMFLMTTLASRDLRGIAFWLMGDLSTALPRGLLWVLVVGFLSATGAIYTTASDLNLLLAGEREAMHLGVDVTRVKLVVYISASVLTGLAVSVSGAIGYVGLLVPHLMRMLFGSDYRLLIPTSAIGGAIAVVLADTLARTIVAPTELPVGAMTAMAGAPFFIYSAAPEAGVSTSDTSALPAPQPEAPAPRCRRTCATHVRVNVEQASYAYAARAHAAPLFTLEATTFQAHERELVAILGPNASGKSTLLRLVRRRHRAALRPRRARRL